MYLCAHINYNFTCSVINIHVDGIDYSVEDEVICYFCFLCKGAMVPLRPGDFLLLIALQYHCLSLRCKKDTDIYCITIYLKTAVVGGNDDKWVLTPDEQKCLETYHKSQGKKRCS